ncbi:MULTISPECIES: FAD-dependent monooxygenase [unclassified Streptomyces]|uniref:FAD-dependent monooxygenase n=1 Tax=unclassified Streptomyces TaxID=2593676 RepID=UPI002E2F372F|nr:MULTISPECIES: FAD-dependent monooxygenase [unclassified Streptomyces]
MRTTIGIVGRGSAGPLLARPPRRAGVDRVVPESGTRACAERRLRGGTLEPGTVEAPRECDTRPARHRRHAAPRIGPRRGRERHRIDLRTRTGGSGVMICPRTEIVQDLIARQPAHGTPLLSEAEVLAAESPRGDAPSRGPNTRAGHGPCAVPARPAATAATTSPARRSRPVRPAPAPTPARTPGPGSSPKSRRPVSSWPGRTRMLHAQPDGDAFDHRIQRARLRRLPTSRTAAAEPAAHPTGLPPGR